MKLILPIDVIDLLKPRLPADVEAVWADADGNLKGGDASDAEIYFNGFYLKQSVLHRVLEAAPNLRWQHTPSAGVDHILKSTKFLERQIILTNSAGVYAIPIAEFVMMLILNRAKQFPALRTRQAQRHWHQEIGFTFQELVDATLLIIGAGSIGQAIADRASAFGMRVWGSRSRPDPLPAFERVVGRDEWRSVLPEADYVVVATPLTTDTIGMIDEAAFRSMRSTAYFINIARGAVVNEPALLTALKEGWIAGAGLDTFSTEPLPAESSFWSLPNVVISPHCSGFSPQNDRRLVELFLDNLTRYRQGQPLKNVVDRQVGY
ncbi:D-2-hydroxyacid dehydrogenase [Thermocoleostomius sinensis]|uniref:D-2-hydroxyacid dehydrogenase n=1 Tax=Thermocoleostomius sinensis A174 TaxID=2016057 RepID=A0A9E9CBJ9_9CYAN|nr:D-2-hydroxyacid dehydrogenase [Thermocoleostomius sinensis]WAL62492.1 D-2-hydroxyacid dehydrogenase [Thermocoleostomius sinensis A174]